MIGIFDSGLGGLTVLRALAHRFASQSFVYLGDHAHVPYGNRSSDEVVELTRRGVEALFERGASLVLLGCNTATTVAARRLQQNWLPNSQWNGRKVLGIVAPTVEAATQTPWAVTTPQYPQKNNTDTIAVFGTTRTVSTGVYSQEIRKRCPNVTVHELVCAQLAGAIEAEATHGRISELVKIATDELMQNTGGAAPHQAILGCTHFPLVEPVFREHLPSTTRILSQPDIVADSLEDYLVRHREHVCSLPHPLDGVRLLTTGDPRLISARARVFWNEAPVFEAA